MKSILSNNFLLFVLYCISLDTLYYVGTYTCAEHDIFQCRYCFLVVELSVNR